MSFVSQRSDSISEEAPLTVGLEELSANTEAYQLDKACTICAGHFSIIKGQRHCW